MSVTSRMLHSLMVQVETYLTHNSFSRRRGGFRIKINGVQIYKEHNDELTRDFDNTIVLTDLLAVFQGYANEVNEACDAEQGSYDAMILFTGRYNFSDVQYGFSKGLAYVGEVCRM